MTDDEADLEAQWLKRELEQTYPRARALMDEVDADDYEAVCLFESDVEAFSNQYARIAAGRSASYCWMQSASRSNSARSPRRVFYP